VWLAASVAYPAGQEILFPHRRRERDTGSAADDEDQRASLERDRFTDQGRVAHRDAAAVRDIDGGAADGEARRTADHSTKKRALVGGPLQAV